MPVMVEWGAILAGLAGAVFGFAALEATTPGLGRQLSLVAPPEVVTEQLVVRLTLDVTEGIQFGLASFLVLSSGRVAWSQRRGRPILFAAVVGASWILVGAWSQRMLTNMFGIHWAMVPWGIVFDALFVLSVAVVAWFIAGTVRHVPAPPRDPDQPLA
jgi:hypothetical protein